ncbi:helix-turn-helix domain-containing protein [Thermophilibacter provencensis]|uniref:Helix-turn-helix transcriptional regulator n=1 Tax=Thermophilibacter provencensis TaxID=1852386 RepID=A0ABT7V343_9ACTN|nr:helix-turn-helix transcriptional regulator [Thermophilibacter provencensis]MDM8271022.1 helix-turn-helix transcriptional regulator [Thermophilibacter provencensis]
MSRPRFSEALVARRHELGLSVRQASKILRLREDVLIAFEEGDYEHMPQSGYAQGMLSSYARYLGLNAREIVDLFQEDLYQYRHGTSSHELRRRTRDTQAGRGVSGYDLPNEAGSRPKAYVEYRPLLPTSGGPAGDMGAFATTAPARPRTSVQLAGVGYAAPGTRSSYRSTAEEYGSARDERPYNSAPTSERSATSTARRRSQTARRHRQDDASGRLLNEGRRSSIPERDDPRGEMRTGRLYRRDDVSTRRVRPSEYTDDLRYDDKASPYAPASTLSGRRSSRNIANVERPNVRRRQARSGGGRRPPRRGGIGGFVEEFLSDPRRALFALIVLLAIVLTAILLFSVSSCMSGRTQGSQTGQVVPVGTTGQDADTSDDADALAESDDQDATDDEASATDEDESPDAQAEPEPDPNTTDDPDATTTDGDEQDADNPEGEGEEEVKETIVKVSVARGEVTWLEITCDGSSEVAQSVTGPWEGTYNVHDSITIQVDSPDAVTVTENGERLNFSSHAGGLGSMTIEGTPLPETDANAEGTTADPAATGQTNSQQ